MKEENEEGSGVDEEQKDSYEYQLPEGFEDEEIDSDEAFNSEDEAMYSHIFENKKVPPKKKAAKAKAKVVRGLDLLNEDDDVVGLFEALQILHKFLIPALAR